MSNTPEISIIVPVYKVEAYLHQCIESILNQTYTNFELLLINDGSPDNCGIICDEFAKKDTRIRVFHKENGGVSSARNLGIDNAQGKWICFVDSDDWVDSDYLSNFTKNKDSNSDIILQGFWFNYEDKLLKEKEIILPNIIITENYQLAKFLEGYNGVHNGFLWHRLFKASVIKMYNISFKDGLSFAEDGLFFFHYLKYTKNFKLTSKIGYHYRIRNSSLTSLGKQITIDTYKILIEGYIETLLSYDVNQSDKKEHYYFIRKYAWRLIESWFLKKAIKNKGQEEEIYNYVSILIRKYQLNILKHPSVSIFILTKMLNRNNSKIKHWSIKRIILYRHYKRIILNKIIQ